MEKGAGRGRWIPTPPIRFPIPIPARLPCEPELMHPAARRILAACLFFSGAASLVMEVAWSRALSLILGNSHQAVATVVASMMTGLFLGSLLAARWLPRLRRLPRFYGLLEIGIGTYG